MWNIWDSWPDQVALCVLFSFLGNRIIQSSIDPGRVCSDMGVSTAWHRSLFQLSFVKMHISLFMQMWCDQGKPVTCCKGWNCKIKEINIIIIMFFFIFYNLWTSVTIDTSIRGDPSKKIWKENNSNFHMIPITQKVNFAPCDRFYQITSQIKFCIILDSLLTTFLIKWPMFWDHPIFLLFLLVCFLTLFH